MAPASLREIRLLQRVSDIGRKLEEISKSVSKSVPQNQVEEFRPFLMLTALYSIWGGNMVKLPDELNSEQSRLYGPTSASLNGLNSAVDELSKLLGSEEEDAASKRKNLIKKMDDIVNKLCKDWQDEWSKEGGEPQESTKET